LSQNVRPEQFLAADRSLRRVRHFWITPTEDRLIRRIDSLERLQARVVATEKDLRKIVESNAASWRQLQDVVAAIEQLEKAKTLAQGNSQREKIQEKLKQHRDLVERLRPQMTDPAKLGGVPAVRARVVDLINSRHAMALSVFWIRQQIPALTDQYRRLGADARVTESLAMLGSPHRLGPSRPYNEHLQRLAERERLVFSSHVPLYLENGRMRIGLIVDDQTPATFTWRESSDPTLVTTSLVQAAAITVADTAPRVHLTVARGRRLVVRRIKIPYVRLGKYVFKDVEAFVLPPEGEDLGSQIGPAGLTGYRVVARPEELRLVVRPEP